MRDHGSLFGRTSADCEETLHRFDCAWVKGDEPRLEAFLLDEPHASSRQQLLAGLVRRDQKWRFRSRCGVSLETYLARWPELSESPGIQTELLESECLWRATYSELPQREELESRFPSIGTLVDLDELARQAETLRVRESFLGTGRFFLTRRVGKGGMGVVYAALDRRRQAIVALKQLPQARGDTLYYFKREFRLLSEIVHPNLVPLYDLISDSNDWFFTMELVEGVDFHSYIRREIDAHHPDEQDPWRHDDETGNWLPWDRLDFERLRDVLRQLALGVCKLHDNGKLHRDLKPSNVLVRPDGTVVLLDFGLITELTPYARAPSPSASAPSDGDSESFYETDWSAVGTPAYMSPEQANGQPLTTASDWYAVGVMLYEALAGNPPLTGHRSQLLARRRNADCAPLPRQGQGIPNDILTLCHDLLSRDPDKRPTGAEVLQHLNAEPCTRHEVTPFVGRKDNLQSLHEMFRRVKVGRAVTVRISGRSGVGKTRLVQQFLQQVIESHEPVVLHGRCYERESVPYKALDSLVDSLARHLAWLPPDECQALMPEDVAALARVFPALQTIKAVAGAPRRLLDIPDLQELRRRAFHSLRKLLKRIGDRAPLVLHIDDLQWGDADSAAVLSQIMRPPDSPRLLLLVCYRSEAEQNTACLQALRQVESLDYRELEVDPLSPDDSRELACILLEGQKNPDLIGRIAREGQGSPYFIAELARHAAGHGEPAAAASLASMLDLDEMLWQRAKQLADEPRRLLESVCVAGSPLRLRWAYAASGVGIQNERALAILKSEHLIRTSGADLDDEIEVFHDRIRESVTGRLDDQTLKTRHAELASALEGDSRADCEAVADHFHAAGEHDKSARYYRLAADQASHALAFNRAARLYRLVLDLRPPADPERDDTQELLGRALANAGRSAEAASEYEAAARQTMTARRLELQREAAYQYLISGHFDTGQQVLRNVLESVGMRLPATPRSALWSLLWGRLHLRLRGLGFRECSHDDVPRRELARLDICWSASIGLAIVDVIRGSDYQTRCLLAALKAGEPLRITRALALESIFMAARGTHTAARSQSLLDAAKKIAARVDAPYAEAVVRLAHSGVAMLTGRYRLACEHSQVAEEIFRNQCRGAAWELDTAQTYKLWSLIWRGEANEVGRLGPALLDEAQQRGDLFATTNLKTYTVPHLLLWHDKPLDALETVDQALKEWSQKGFFAQHMLAMVSSSEVALYRGDGQAAWKLLSEHWPAYEASLLNRIQYGFIQLLYSRARSAILVAQQSAEPAAWLRRAERDAKKLDRERRGDAFAMAAAIRAGIAMTHRDFETAVTHLRIAVEKYSTMEMTLHAASARRALGCILGGDEGRSMVQQADAAMHCKSVHAPSRLAVALVPGVEHE